MAAKTNEQDILKNSFELWRKYTQTYTDLAMESWQEAMKQSLATREQFSKVMVESVKQAQELGFQEREAVMEMTESFNQQVREAGEQFRKAVTPDKGS